MKNVLQRNALLLAWIISLVGFILSFYYGEICQIEPCRLCWYQRTALFPLVLILGIAAYWGDRTVFRYAFPFAVLGTLFALYQALEPYLPLLQSESICGEENGCLEPPFTLWGVVTFPVLSAIGFALVAFLLILERFSKNR